jgi:hypothetical protein
MGTGVLAILMLGISSFLADYTVSKHPASLVASGPE